jgi:hypothetical protein
MFTPPDKIAPMEPDEFTDAYQYAGMVAEYDFVEQIPAIERKIEIGDQTIGFTNHPMNRFGFAIVGHFKGRRDKVESFMTRFFALMQLRKHKGMKPFVKDGDDCTEIHGAVMEVVATHPLSARGRFSPSSFFAEVRRVKDRMDREESKNDT